MIASVVAGSTLPTEGGRKNGWEKSPTVREGNLEIGWKKTAEEGFHRVHYKIVGTEEVVQVSNEMFNRFSPDLKDRIRFAGEIH